MSVVNLADIEAGLGHPLSAPESAQATQWIGDAELLIRLRLGPLDALDLGALRFVIRESVLNRLRNPDGYLSETVDDYTYRHGSETRRVTILDEWWALLDPDSSQASASIRPGFEPDAVRWPVSTPPAYVDREFTSRETYR